MNLSICIPTYNRAPHLANCLQSIISNRSRIEIDFEVCVSDNCSTDDTESVVRHAQISIPIKYYRSKENLGRVRNYLKVVEMAAGEFVWLLGDDDLLLPFALEEISELIDQHKKDVDFFYINACHLATEYVASFPQPFSTAHLPADMLPFSSWQYSGEMLFMDLVDPRISFDFLGGMFLAVFRRRNWIENVQALDVVAVMDLRTFSHFDNTFPHLKIFARAFADSKAFFCAKPLSVCLTGAREWAPMFPLVKSVRLVELLHEYRKNGLPFIRYLQCKNFALSSFLPDLARMYINKQNSGYSYINPFQLILANCLFPNMYFSVVYFFVDKLKVRFAN